MCISNSHPMSHVLSISVLMLSFPALHIPSQVRCPLSSLASVTSNTLNKLHMSLMVSVAICWNSALPQTLAISSLVHLVHERTRCLLSDSLLPCSRHPASPRSRHESRAALESREPFKGAIKWIFRLSAVTSLRPWVVLVSPCYIAYLKWYAFRNKNLTHFMSY